MEQGHSVPSHKVWRGAFYGRWGTNFLDKFFGRLLYIKGYWSVQLPIMKGYKLEDKSWPVNTIVKVFIPEVNCWEFSKVVSWLAWPWYFICKVTSTNRVLLLKNTLCPLCLSGWGFHPMSFFNCNILQVATIMELF